MSNTRADQQRFQDACAKIQQSVNKHVSQIENDFDSSSEEEELEEQNILKSVFGAYYGENVEDIKRNHDILIDSVKSGATVCLICIASVKRQDAIWNCDCCYASFHLTCIQKWAKDSLFHQTSQVEDLRTVDKSQFTWCCPKCRNEYSQLNRPSYYFCYCKKLKNPFFDPWIIPHSCGGKCEKKLVPECGHRCLLLCHPGPCPPCPQTVKSKCYCGQTSPVTRRCSNRSWSCRHVCGRNLTCGQHKCTQICHEGECLACPKESIQKCVCGKKQKTTPCSSPIWKCDSPCGRIFDCSVHECKEICHTGDDCGKCPRSGLRSCPCGKTSLSLPCTEDIPTCGDTCAKSLPCGLHSCSQRCHYGPCGNCLQVIKKRCRCGLKEKMLPCHKDYTCESKCKQIRDCGRHPCSRKCCIGDCPPCEQQCGRSLGCRNHKCSSPCHRGPCYPCMLTVKISCNCGKTIRNMPCGRDKVTKPPRCKKPCTKKPDCHHPFRTPHICHFGDCPPCVQICHKKLTNCGHNCPAPCHTAVLTKVNNNKQKRAGPWELQPMPVMQLINKPCPPCLVPIPVTCIGNHETCNIPCFEVRDCSCGRPCGRLLKCTNHNCSLQCHRVIDSPNNSTAGSNCEGCVRDCSKPRIPGCTHKCVKPCHRGQCPPCKQMIRVKCHCSMIQLYVPCEQWTSTDDIGVKDEMASCKNQCPKELPCKHRCQKICHRGECTPTSECKKRVAVRCACKRRKKEFVCHERVAVDCDGTCTERQDRERVKRIEDEREMRRAEEEKEKQELEYYRRKLEGKKRKPKKQKEIVVSQSFLKKNLNVISISLFGAILGISIYYFIKF